MRELYSYKAASLYISTFTICSAYWHILLKRHLLALGQGLQLRNTTSFHRTFVKMNPVIILSLFALCICALEPPFSAAVVQELDRLSSLPSLISTDQLLAGISPAELAAFLASASTDTTNNSQPNPIAKTFPNMTTGTINGSLIVLPLDYSVARAIIPSKYGILNQSIKAVLAFFPEDKYPVRNPDHLHAALVLTRNCSSFFLLRLITTFRTLGSLFLISPSVVLLNACYRSRTTIAFTVFSISLPVHRSFRRRIFHLLIQFHALHLE